MGSFAIGSFIDIDGFVNSTSVVTSEESVRRLEVLCTIMK